MSHVRPGAFVAVALLVAPSALGAVQRDCTGTGEYWTKVEVNGHYHATTFASGDIDGDGDEDLAGHHSFEGLYWYENVAGDGTHWTSHTIADLFNSNLGFHGLSMADLDQDGDLDVLAVVFMGEVYWYENVNGDGTEWVGRSLGVHHRGTSPVAADLDGDGDLDVLSGTTEGTLVRWHENLGDALAWTTHPIAFHADCPVSVGAADLDGDGDLDAFAAYATSGEIHWYENANGDASSWTPMLIQSAVAGAAFVTAGDLDGDGDLDLASAAEGSGEIAWHENLAGDGSSWSTFVLGGGPTLTTVDLALGDMDLDGDLDVFARSPFDPGVSWYENFAGDGSTWSEHTVASARFPRETLLLADLDGDGDLDGVGARGLIAGRVTAYLNTAGDGSAWEECSIHTSLRAASTELADMNGDGRLDVLVADRVHAFVFWFESTSADGTRWKRHFLGDAIVDVTSARAADVDGDGDLDALSTSDLTGRVAWYENEGFATDWPDQVLSGGASGVQELIPADLDGDGDFDVLWFADYEIRWIENELGDGSSWTQHPIALLTLDTRAVEVADVDDDGDLDIFVACFDDDSVIWLENLLGDGSSWLKHTVDDAFDSAGLLCVADLDLDGAVDVVSASTAPFAHGSIVRYLNELGDGTSWAFQTIADPVYIPSALVPGDFDGDGDPDVASTSGEAANGFLAWHENRPGEPWGLWLVEGGLGNLDVVTAGDFDGDGDDDLIAQHYPSAVTIYRNSFRGGVETRDVPPNPNSYTITQPTLGRSMVATVDLTTTGHNAALVVGYVASLTVALGGGQVLLVDLFHPIGELFGLPLAFGPTATFEIPVPGVPSLCGFELYTQAVHLGGVQPFALSNGLDLTLGE